MCKLFEDFEVLFTEFRKKEKTIQGRIRKYSILKKVKIKSARFKIAKQRARTFTA